MHRAAKRRKASKEKVDAAEQDLVNATRHAIVLEGGKEQASLALVLALEELSDRTYKLAEARKLAKAADKALDIALAARKERPE